MEQDFARRNRAPAPGTALVALDAGPVAPRLPFSDADATRLREDLDAALAPNTRRAYASDWRMFTAWCDARGLAAVPAPPPAVALYLGDLQRGWQPTVLPDALMDAATDGAVGVAANGVGSASERGDAEEEDGVGLGGDDAGLDPFCAHTPPPLRPRSRATVTRHLAAIVHFHRAAGAAPPTEQPGAHLLDRALAGIRRRLRDVPQAKKRAADGDVLRDMLRAVTGDGIRAVRDRALLAIGMAGALRRSELAALHCAHVRAVPGGLEVLVASSKTDKEGLGELVVIPDGKRIAPVDLLHAWQAASGIRSGPLFRRLTRSDRVTPHAMTPESIALVVKARAAAAGYDATEFSGHSLRSGFLTEAARQPFANVFRMREHSRHKSVQMVSAYVEGRDKLRDHAGEGFL